MANWQEITFGVEVELKTSMSGPQLAAVLTRAGVSAYFAGYTHQTTAQWKIVSDASVRGGWEVVSPILRGEAGMADLRKVLVALNDAGCTVDRTCGIHVHTGARGATAGQVANVAKMFLRYEREFDKLVPESRRASNNMYCRSNRGRFTSMAQAMTRLNGCTTVSEVADLMNGGNRYHKFNLQSYRTHGTIEFRQHGGSVDAVKVCAWVRLITGFVAAGYSARRVTDADDATLGGLLRMTDSAGEQYLTERADRFAGRA